MMELVQLQKSLERFEDLGVAVVAVTNDDTEGIDKARKRVRATFPIVRDHEETLMDTFGLRDQTSNPSGRDILRSASVLLSPRGEILWQTRAEYYRVRPSPDQVLESITEVLMNTL